MKVRESPATIENNSRSGAAIFAMFVAGNKKERIQL
jgi:hypothetical protein